MGHSGIEAIDALADHYAKADKKLHLVHLSKDCYNALTKASQNVSLNEIEDLHYSVILSSD